MLLLLKLSVLHRPIFPEMITPV